MSEITRVPLQPVARGSLTRLWLGVVAALALGGAAAYETRSRGLEIETVAAGSGAMPVSGDVVLVNYVGRLTNGKEFDRGDRVPMPVDGVIPGFSQGLQKMRKGGKYRLAIPAAMAYGAQEQKNQATGEVVIPRNSDLVFDVEVLEIKSAAEIEQMRQRMMQMQMQMQQRGGAGGRAEPGAMPPGMDSAPAQP